MVAFPAVVTEASDHRCMLGLCPLDLAAARSIPEIWVLVNGDLAGHPHTHTGGGGGGAGRGGTMRPRLPAAGRGGDGIPWVGGVWGGWRRLPGPEGCDSADGGWGRGTPGACGERGADGAAVP